MAEIINPKKFLELAQQYPVVDVRSPAEYEAGHIPGAHNIPLFDNNERAEVGTLYKQVGRREAILRGLELAGAKLSWYVKEALKLSPKEKVLVHCWRGGMRSSSFAWFLESADMKAYLLEGGYKAYRHHIREHFARAERIIILGGMTGSGKTEVLHKLRGMGEQVIDLEGFANHKGSAFGAIGQDEQPTTEQFENDTAREWLGFDQTQRIWVEDESLKIGRCVINETLFEKMRSAPVIVINLPFERRVDRLLEEYCYVPASQLISVVYRIQRRLGDVRKKRAIESFESGDYRIAMEVLLDYYDRGYEHGRSKRDQSTISYLNFTNESCIDIAAKLITFADSM